MLKIRLYDLRHWFGTATYIQTSDLLHTKYALGHKSISNTMKYIHLANGLLDYSEDFVCKVAKNLDEAVMLIESGFEYITEMDGLSYSVRGNDLRHVLFPFL